VKAIVQDRYGSPDVLKLREIDQPVAADNQVLVRVHAAAVNARDWHLMRGDPYIARMVSGFRGPKVKIRGTDFAVGWKRLAGRWKGSAPVTRCSASSTEHFAEYVCVPDEAVEPKPVQPDVRAGGCGAACGQHRAHGSCATWRG
jgi:NADPH:quinone reductase-like Zn-dependent oxidoreductase